MRSANSILFTFAILIFSTGCDSGEQGDPSIVDDPAGQDDGTNLPLSSIDLPPGFEISVFAEVIGPRSTTKSPEGTIFVGNRSQNKVWALKDNDGDFKADQKTEVDFGLNVPNGVAFREGDLYVAEIDRILIYSNIEETLASQPEPEVVFDGYPDEQHHGWKYIAFGPDGMLYVPVGAPCNICESGPEVFASITRINPDGSGMEVFAHGVRNSVGFDWHPETGELWFTDNGRDSMGDELPPCELNKAPQMGMNFGYPHCHGSTVQDPEFGEGTSCNDFAAPEYNFRAHTAPLGMRFYTGDMFPAEYRNQILVAQHGSWDRSSKIGYRIMMVKIENDRAVEAQVFADGWLNESSDQAWGRPVDILQLQDGSILVSDDQANVIYRICYKS